MVKEAITPPIAKKKLTQSTKQRNHKHLKKYTSSSNKSDKAKSLDKSRSTKITETENTVKTVNKPGSISSTSISGKVPKQKNHQK